MFARNPLPAALKLEMPSEAFLHVSYPGASFQRNGRSGLRLERQPKTHIEVYYRVILKFGEINEKLLQVIVASQSEAVSNLGIR